MNLRFIAIAIFLSSTTLFAQKFKVNSSYTPEEYLYYLLDTNNVKISNVKYMGRPEAMGMFLFNNNNFGIKRGVVMSTGEVKTIGGGNKTPGTSGRAWDNKHRFKRDRDLSKLSRGKVCDQAFIEFDFIPLENEMSFQFIFASEEYKEYVGSRFNDVFGFFITGDDNFHKNIAVVPERLIPVSVNNVNHITNSKYYINNTCFENSNIKKDINEFEPRKPFVKEVIDKLFGQVDKDFTINKEVYNTLDKDLFNNFEFDGVTTKIPAVAYLTPYKVYHMKIAIGDVGDPMFDSGVFIEKESFTSRKNKDAPFFTDYEDLRGKIDFDSLFHIKEETPIVVIDSPPPILEKFEITNINFDYNKDLVPDSSVIHIRDLSEYLNENPSYKVQILGYTDNIGSVDYNQELSDRRAAAVKKLLEDNGVGAYRLTYIGNNFSNPLADNDSEEGRKLNRRVEIVLIED